MAKSKQKSYAYTYRCYAVLCLSLPITLPAQKEHKYLDHALPEAWQENDSDFQQTLPVDDQWWKNFNDPTLDSLIEVAVKQNYSVLMAADRIAMAKANLRIQQGSYSADPGTRCPAGPGNKAAAIRAACRRQRPNTAMPPCP